MRNRQLGRFVLHERFFRDLSDFAGVSMFRDMIVLDVRRNFLCATVEYSALHPQFREVREGDVIPEYEAVFEFGKATPTWREKPLDRWTRT
jgi:hypothetical protein